MIVGYVIKWRGMDGKLDGSYFERFVERAGDARSKSLWGTRATAKVFASRKEAVTMTDEWGYDAWRKDGPGPAIVRLTRAFKSSTLPPWWMESVKRLESSAEECTGVAYASFSDAMSIVRRDPDAALRHAIDGLMAIGEARGHRNALYDLTQDGDRKALVKRGPRAMKAKKGGNR